MEKAKRRSIRVVLIKKREQLVKFQYIVKPECVTDTNGRSLIHLEELNNPNAITKATDTINHYYFHTLNYSSHRSNNFWENFIKHFGVYIRNNLLPFTSSNTASSHNVEHQECVNILLRNLDPLSIYDENIALELFNKLFINENQLNKKKRVYYTGLSSRTNRRKNQQLCKPAVGTAQISKFFIPSNQQKTNPSLLIQNEQPNENNKEILDTSIQNNNNKDKIEDAIKFIKNILLENISNSKRIPINKGKFSSRSLLNDELVSLRISSYLWANKFQINPLMQTISISTAHKWIYKMDFRHTHYRKGTYIDSHNGQDMIVYHEKFLEMVQYYEQFMSQWLDKECKIRTYSQLNPGEKEHVWITHDESIFYSYDGSCAV
ncbi:hypothetical protein Glove_274g41 [Diversispora epigaea]|uniref:Uncharacterized protein n=1 Tax=Diversispora epigaea TaxID=1348612 RepID=A0A397I3W1_9GLOM|nr:hypothetical protein Glove_274g41 [Diversispora epigaea]